MILDKLAASARVRVDRLKGERPLESVREEALSIKPEKPFCFEAALKKEDIAFICEVKKASPSKGLIAPDFPYVHIARDYEAAGADAISVLTEPQYFLGRDDYLSAVKRAVSIPVIRKDFTIDPYQIYEARIIGADAVLLICALLDTKALTEYIRIADSLGLSALVEAHDAATTGTLKPLRSTSKTVRASGSWCPSISSLSLKAALKPPGILTRSGKTAPTQCSSVRL